ncbi:MAG: type VI secretion system baseplate subunit TssK [Myxococcales bacterium]|nr:type VI secretion system baseplate subunit TssK [Myxococcales bacterium]
MQHRSRQPRWSEGLLLCPQHLQAQDDYHEGRVDRLLAALHPITWGLVDCELDPAALSRGEIELRRLRAVLPDGTPIDWGPESDLPPPRRSLGGEPRPLGARILVRAALPISRAGARNFRRADEEGPPRRFVLRERLGYDLGDEHPPRKVEVLELAPLLLVDDEPAPGMTTLPIAALQRRGDGGLEIDERFIPPLLRVGGSPGLSAALRRILAAAIRRRRQLQSERRRRGGRIEYRGGDLDRHLMVHALSRALPRLRALVEGPPAHPLVAHQVLAELVGELSSFLADGDPATLPLYDHADAAASFAPLLELARRLIDLPLAEELLSIPLAARGAGVFASERLDAQLQGARAVFLAIEGEAGLGRDRAALPELVKVAAGRRIDAIIRSNSRGAPAHLVVDPPTLLPRSDDAVYLAVDTRDPHWQEVLYQRDLAVHLSSPIDARGLRLRLLALPANGSDHGLAAESRDACA